VGSGIWEPVFKDLSGKPKNAQKQGEKNN